ncbi:MAG: carboxymuconolactone decarboxylase family protein [Actinomycetota bacterium]
MAFIEPIPEEDAEGATAELYAADLDEDGYVANSTKAFGHRPAVFAAWRQLGTTIGGSMDRRRYELATVAAARVLRSSYCSLAHGKVLAEQFLDVVLAAAARCFFSTVLEALGVQADAAFRALDPELREALTVGRPIAED